MTRTIPVIFDGKPPSRGEISALELHEQENAVALGREKDEHTDEGLRRSSPTSDERQPSSRRSEKAFNPNQPREPKGSPIGGQWTSSNAGATAEPEKKSGIRSYVEMVAQGFGGQRNPAHDWFANHGQNFIIDEETFIGGEPKQCYKNAFRAMMSNEFGGEDSEELSYVEGFIAVHGVPIHHAWLVTKDGKVRDYTLREESRSYVTEYFGVPLDWEYVTKATLKQGVYGLTTGDSYRAFAQILKDGDKALKNKGGK